MRVVVLVSHTVALALLLKLLELHRSQVAKQVFLLGAGLEGRLVSLDEDATSRALLHGLEAGTLRSDDHSNEVDTVSVRNLDPLLEKFRVLQQTVDVWKHAWTPVVIVGRRVKGQCVALGHQTVIQSEVLL